MNKDSNDDDDDNDDQLDSNLNVIKMFRYF